ncbi:MAG: hypothetical protein ACK4TC_09495 [Sphingomonas pseudosanguinis]|uniref:hypothetical protein n=1 Tax=Sphingomonas pseudosanguinis TaxID=413712 RepID=UPI00391CE20C
MLVRVALVLLPCVAMLSGCNSEVRAAERELETVRASQAKRSLGRDADNAELCRAYTKLHDAYLKAGDTTKYDETKLFVATYC